MSTNVTSVEATRRINPGRIGSSNPLAHEVAAHGCEPVRRLTRLDADYYAAQLPTPTMGMPAAWPPKALHKPVSAPDRAWLRVVERAVGGWAPTLRQSVALVTLFLVAAVAVVVTLGLVGVVLVTCLAIVLLWRHAAARIPRA
jgi:hypothetical protein